MKKIKVTIPRHYMNCGVTVKGNFVADTNVSTEFDELRFPLPKGKWRIYSKNGCHLILVKDTLLPYFKFEWWARKDTKWFQWYKNNQFTFITVFKYIHLRITDSKLDYDELPSVSG